MAPNRQISPIDYELIRNTIALYCIALDTKDFDLFNKIFLEDVVTVYPFGGQRRGVDDIKAAIEKRYVFTISSSICFRSNHELMVD